MGTIRTIRARILLVAAALGPGFITANVDNDAGGIYTYSTAGAQFGYSLLWTVLPMALALALAQETCARMGVVTGKTLSGLIRERFGFRVSLLLMLVLAITNFGNVLAEFAGVASSLELFGISKYVSVPAAALLVWWLVVFSDYKRVEKVFLFASFLYIAYIGAALLARPAWGAALRSAFTLPGYSQLREPAYLYLAIGLIGATVAPWQQFYLQSSVVDKGLRLKSLKLSQSDAVTGAIFSIVVAAFIVIACAATLFVSEHRQISSAADAARALEPLAGEYAFVLFAVGLLNASLFAAAVLPLSTAYSICEALGLESGLNKRFREAPGFYWLYTATIAGGAAFVLLPGFPLVRISVLSQVLNGVLLPVVLVFMVVLASDPELMAGFQHSRGYKLLAWSVTALLSALTIAMLLTVR